MFSANILPITNFIWIFACTVLAANLQNVYVDNYNACRYNISGKYVEFQNITERATREDLTVYYNFCNGLADTKGCDSAAKVCVLKANMPFIPNGGNSFTSTRNQLMSMGSTRCGKILYTTVINFDVDHHEKPTFQINGCDIIITINPTPACTVNYRGFHLDLTPLSEVSDIIVHNNNNTHNSTYSLGICNYSANCGRPYTGCITETEEKFTRLDTQTIDYDYTENKLIVKGWVSKKKHSTIQINCNWFTTVGKTEKLVKKYEFAIESKYGCVKLPINCSIIKNDRYLYNISNLNRRAGWKVNTPNGTLFINVCGPLELQQKSACTDIYSQVCLRTNAGEIAYGSLTKPITMLEQGLQMDILYGSKCPNNASILLGTSIKFECGRSERGPTILNSTDPCMQRLLWQTPEACPKDLELADVDFNVENEKQAAIDCNVGELFDLNPLVLHDRNYNISDSAGNVYHINLCRPLFLNKDTFACKGSTACMIDTSDVNEETKYSAFGSPKVPQLIDDTLVVTYGGGWYEGYPREIQIKFECLMDGKDEIIFDNKTNTKIQFTWKTELVCKKAFIKCHNIFDFDKISNHAVVINTGSLKYDFTLCDSQYSVTTLNSGRVIQHYANTSITYMHSKYNLIYRLNNTDECVDLHRLKTVYMRFICDKKVTDYYEVESIDDCVLHMKFWTSQACNNDTSVEENDETRKATSVITAKNAAVKPNCSLNFQDTEPLDLNTLLPVKAVSKNGNVYQIANKSSTCGDFICKNNQTAGSASLLCPNFIVDVLSHYVQINFIGSMCSNKEIYKVSLTYKCKESQSEVPKVLTETACSANIEVSDDFVCGRFKSIALSDGTSNAGIITGIVILSLILVSVIGILVWRYLRRNNYITLDKSRVYIRNLRR